MKRYHIHLPSDFYPFTAYGTSKRDAIDRFKKQWGFKRMPNGYAIWES